MTTGYGLLARDKAFRDHCARRLAAFLLDWVIFFEVSWFTMYFIFPAWSWLWQVGGSLILSGILLYLYSGLLEGFFGMTLGKRAAELEVSLVDMKFEEVPAAMIRSFPKIFWYIFLPVDVLVGLGTSEDPRQRCSDRLASTVVINTDTAGPYSQTRFGTAPPLAFPTTPEIAPASHASGASAGSGSHAPSHSQQSSSASGSAQEICRDCKGVLKVEQDGRYRCTRCGLIQ